MTTQCPAFALIIVVVTFQITPGHLEKPKTSNEKCVAGVTQMMKEFDKDLLTIINLPIDVRTAAQEAIQAGELSVYTTIKPFFEKLDDLHQQHNFTPRCFYSKKDLLEQIPRIFDEEIRSCVNHALDKMVNIEKSLGSIADHQSYFANLHEKVGDCKDPGKKFQKYFKEMQHTFDQLKADSQGIIANAEKKAKEIKEVFDFCGRDRKDVVEEEANLILEGIRECLDSIGI